MNRRSIFETLRSLLRKRNTPVYVVGAEEVIKPTSYPCIIVKNTDYSWEVGKHWICFFVLSSHRYHYFDSYGNELSTYPNVVPPSGIIVKENCNVLQSASTYLCGEYCVWFAFSRALGVSYEAFLSRFSNNVRTNDCLVRRFASSIPGIHPHNIYSNIHREQTCLCRRLCPTSFDKYLNKMKK